MLSHFLLPGTMNAFYSSDSQIFYRSSHSCQEQRFYFPDKISDQTEKATRALRLLYHERLQAIDMHNIPVNNLRNKITQPILVVCYLWVVTCVCFIPPLSVSATQDIAEAKVKAAGCFIPTPKGIVLGIHRVFRDIRIPFGSRKSGETARQTAARETLEETGLYVTVGPLLQTFENDTALLFQCTPETPIEDHSRLRPLDTLEMFEVIVMDPTTMLNHDGRRIRNAWRMRGDRDLLIQLFEEHKSREIQ